MSRRTRFFAVASLSLLLTVAAHAEDVIPLVNWPVAPWPGPSAAPVKGEQQTFQKDITSASLSFVPMEPCRVVDTRSPSGPFGGPGFAANETRTYNFPAHPTCTGIPATAIAYSVNVTVVSYALSGGWVTAYPNGVARPFVSTVNFGTGPAVANAAVVPASGTGRIDVYATNTTHVVLDINGYFIGARIKAMTPTATPGTYSALLFNVQVLTNTATGGKVPFTIFAINTPEPSVEYLAAHGTIVYYAVSYLGGEGGSTQCTIPPTETLLQISNPASMGTITATPTFCPLPGEPIASRVCCTLTLSGLTFTPGIINVGYDISNAPGTGVTAVP